MSDQTTTLVKEEPPEIQRGGANTGTLAAELAPLLDDPGEWYRFRSGLKETQARSLAYNIKKRFATSDGYFETRARKQPDGTAGVWVRYVAGETPTPAPRKGRSRSTSAENAAAVA